MVYGTVCGVKRRNRANRVNVLDFGNTSAFSENYRERVNV